MIDGLIIDNFAGGGGASTGIEWATGRSPDVAINHDAEALAMHAANHPATRHYCQDIWQVDPIEVVRDAGGGPVGLAWFSPDCKDFSKAKGGKPVRKHIRDLAWVVVKWARRVRPRVIMLENVEEFRDWGSLRADNTRCPDRRGQTFDRWVGELRRLGYQVEWRQLRACDYGAPTIRKRLFLIARCDGAPIVWPAPSHGPGLVPFRTAADCIDFALPCPSIFTRKRPLADATMRRIARGIQRYVIGTDQPFIVPLTHRGDDRVHSIAEPLRTITTAQRGEFALVTAFIAKHFGGMTGTEITNPLPTVTARGTQNQLVTSHLVKLRGTCRDGQPVTEPMPTITAGGQHVGEVRAFLMKYYGTGGQHQSLREPMHTVTTKARLGLVAVAGVDYQIADIGMRMLSPRELFRAQGFGDAYRLDPEHDGRPLTKTAQIRLCGNSVSPDPAEALLRANFDRVDYAVAA